MIINVHFTPWHPLSILWHSFEDSTMKFRSNIIPFGKCPLKRYVFAKFEFPAQKM